MIDAAAFTRIKEELGTRAELVAVSKFKSVEDIRALYELGQRDFGENYVQELLDKKEQLPEDIRWHFIGHLQSNKVKHIAAVVHLIQGVDSEKLLAEISKQGSKLGRSIDVLLQVHLGDEETKFGFAEEELTRVAGLAQSNEALFGGVRICGLMGMASNTDDVPVIRNEYHYLADLFRRLSETVFADLNHFKVLSMGMSGDYEAALEEGSNMVRIGSLIFGQR